MGAEGYPASDTIQYTRVTKVLAPWLNFMFPTMAISHQRYALAHKTHQIPPLKEFPRNPSQLPEIPSETLPGHKGCYPEFPPLTI